jgi:hypothetical protein
MADAFSDFVALPGDVLNSMPILRRRGVSTPPQEPRIALTDAGLVHFQRLTSLRKLTLAKTRVTEAGAARLKKTLPSLTIDRW